MAGAHQRPIDLQTDGAAQRLELARRYFEFHGNKIDRRRMQVKEYFNNFRNKVVSRLTIRPVCTMLGATGRSLAMKRLHVHVAVDDLSTSVRFYSTLFAAAPSVLKDDYAKW